MTEIQDIDFLINVLGEGLPRALELAGSMEQGLPALEEDEQLVIRAAVARELAAFSLLSTKQRDRTDVWLDALRNAAGDAFDLLRVVPLPPQHQDLEVVHRIVELGSLSVCADRLSDFRKWLSLDGSLEGQIPEPKGERWDRRVFFTVGHCWIDLLKGEGLEGIPEAIAELRREQKDGETILRSRAIQENGTGEVDGISLRNMALRLASLYHLSKAVEVVSQLVTGSPCQSDLKFLECQFVSAAQTAQLAGEMSLWDMVEWLRGVVCTMDGFGLAKIHGESDPLFPNSH